MSSCTTSAASRARRRAPARPAEAVASVPNGGRLLPRSSQRLLPGAGDCFGSGLARAGRSQWRPLAHYVDGSWRDRNAMDAVARRRPAEGAKGGPIARFGAVGNSAAPAPAGESPRGWPEMSRSADGTRARRGPARGVPMKRHWKLSASLEPPHAPLALEPTAARRGWSCCLIRGALDGPFETAGPEADPRREMLAAWLEGRASSRSSAPEPKIQFEPVLSLHLL